MGRVATCVRVRVGVKGKVLTYEYVCICLGLETAREGKVRAEKWTFLLGRVKETK